MTNNLYLSGLKIVVTRPKHQAVQLTHRIEQAGGQAMLFPLLDITEVGDVQTLQEKISHLGKYDLAIFVSPNAVHYGMAAIRKTGKLPAKLKIAAIGQGSAATLHGLGVDQVIAPTERYDSEGLLSRPELQNVAGWKVMILRGESGRELLGDTLKARGATVEYVACYRRSKPQLNPESLLAAEPDAISVTSSEALEHLWQVFDSEARNTLRELQLFVPHARIAELALQQGWRHVHLTESGDDGLLAALRVGAEKKG